MIEKQYQTQDGQPRLGTNRVVSTGRKLLRIGIETNCQTFPPLENNDIMSKADSNSK